MVSLASASASASAAAASLSATLRAKKSGLPYVNLNAEGQYAGWVASFNTQMKNGEVFRLNLKCEQDLFLLFTLAIVWSRTGPWENAVFFVIWMKISEKADPRLWCSDEFVQQEERLRDRSLADVLASIEQPAFRKKPVFRKDLYQSVAVLARNWDATLQAMKTMRDTRDYFGFWTYMRSLKGLGSGDKSMFIKLPLIMRELRCQLYPDIPGEFCCVPDARVYLAVKQLAEQGVDMQICRPNSSIKGLFRASARIYELFGDLYDVPLFAYPDLFER